jgi:hypothetical protein
VVIGSSVYHATQSVKSFQEYELRFPFGAPAWVLNYDVFKVHVEPQYENTHPDLRFTRHVEIPRDQQRLVNQLAVCGYYSIQVGCAPQCQIGRGMGGQGEVNNLTEQVCVQSRYAILKLLTTFARLEKQPTITREDYERLWETHNATSVVLDGEDVDMADGESTRVRSAAAVPPVAIQAQHDGSGATE